MSPFKQALLIVFVVLLLPLQGFADTCTEPGTLPVSFAGANGGTCYPQSGNSICGKFLRDKTTYPSFKNSADEWCKSNGSCSADGKSCVSGSSCSVYKEGTTSSGCTIINDVKYCYMVPKCTDAAQTYAWAQGFLKNFLEPFYEMIIIVARLIGIFLVMWGLMRVRRHGQHNMMYRLSPMATAMFFVVGAVFAAFMPFALSFSGGIFGNTTIDATNFKNSTGLNQNLVYKCSEGGGNTSAADLSGAVYCPVLGYANEVDTNKGSLQDDPQKAMMQVVYAVLLVIGVISFLRGFLFLLRMGEGNSQEGSMQKAVTHIIAGVIGMNAQSFQDLLTGALPSHTGT